MLLPPREAPPCHHGNSCRALGPSSPLGPHPGRSVRGHPGWRHLAIGPSTRSQAPQGTPYPLGGLCLETAWNVGHPSPLPGLALSSIFHLRSFQAEAAQSVGFHPVCWVLAEKACSFHPAVPEQAPLCSNPPKAKTICFLPRSISTFSWCHREWKTALEAEPPSWPPEPQLHSHRDPAGGAAWFSQEESGQCSSCWSPGAQWWRLREES